VDRAIRTLSTANASPWWAPRAIRTSSAGWRLPNWAARGYRSFPCIHRARDCQRAVLSNLTALRGQVTACSSSRPARASSDGLREAAAIGLKNVWLAARRRIAEVGAVRSTGITWSP